MRDKRGRLSLRLSSKEFVEEVHSYAKKHNTTASALVEGYLTELLQEEKRLILEAEQF